MKREKITIVNAFHNTECRVVPNERGIISHRTCLSVQRELCGVEGCRCGAIIGTRGSENPQIETVSVDVTTDYWIRFVD